MMSQRRSTAACLAVLLLSLVLAACGPVTPVPLTAQAVTGTSAAGPTAEPATPAPPSSLGIPEEALKGVQVSAWMPWFGLDAALFESQVAEFNKDNTWGITVLPVSQQNYSELYEQVTNVLPTPDRPQLLIALPEQTLTWQSSGQVVDLTRYVNDPRYGLTPDDVKDFTPLFWAQDMAGDQRLGVPAQRTAGFLLYNAGWARELGFVSPPSSPTDFQQQACRAHQAMLTNDDRTDDGQGGWLVDTSATTFLAWMNAFGGGVAAGGGYHFLTPKNLAALTYIKQLYDAGCGWTAQPGADVPAAFAARKALFATAALEDLPAFARAMASAGSRDEWTVLPFPSNGKQVVYAYGSSYVVMKSTPEQQLAAWLFVRWLLAPERQKRWVEVNGMFPLRSSEMELLGDYQKGHPQWTEAVALLPKAQPEPQLTSWRKMKIVIADGFNAMFRSDMLAGRVAEILAIMDTTAADLTK